MGRAGEEASLEVEHGAEPGHRRLERRAVRLGDPGERRAAHDVEAQRPRRVEALERLVGRVVDEERRLDTVVGFCLLYTSPSPRD